MVLHLFRRSSARMCLSIFPTNISKKQSFDVTPSANFMTPSANPISGVWYESAHVGPILLLTGTSCNSEKSVRQSQWPAPPMVLRLFHRSSARMCLSNVATNILSKKQSFDVTPSANFMTPSANPISRVKFNIAESKHLLENGLAAEAGRQFLLIYTVRSNTSESESSSRNGLAAEAGQQFFTTAKSSHSPKSKTHSLCKIEWLCPRMHVTPKRAKLHLPAVGDKCNIAHFGVT